MCVLVAIDPDEYVKKNVATLIREIARHTPEVWFCNKLVQFICCSCTIVFISCVCLY